MTPQRSFSEDPILKEIQANPLLIFERSKVIPDPWQERVLLSPSKMINILASRRVGKSFSASGRALCKSIHDEHLTIVLSPTLRQSIEFLRLVKRLYRLSHFPLPIERQNLTEIEFQNGSRIVSLPDNPGGIVGLTPNLIVIDEASRASDELYQEVRPMLMLGQCDMMVLSTPFGKRGWFYDTWEKKELAQEWEQYKITADMCSRIKPQDLEKERVIAGDRYFKQQYFCEFRDTIDAFFSRESIERAIKTDIQPLFGMGV